VRFDAYKTTESGGRAWRSIDGYGGLYTENVVQAISRDLLVHAMWQAEGQGWPIVMHVHDELVCEVDEFASDPRGLEQIMRSGPDWAAGLPLNSAGWEHDRFTK
jgi:DNA polymerase